MVEWPRYTHLVVGTRSWRSVGYASFSLYELKFPTYLNGALHWLRVDFGNEDLIVSFDFDNEQFHSFPAPIHICGIWGIKKKTLISVGVLNDCLCICDASVFGSIRIWAMKRYGVQESRTRVFSINTENGQRWPQGLYQPVKKFKNGAILMYHAACNCLLYYDPSRKEHQYLKIQGSESNFETAIYIPSFSSLKDVGVGDNAEVLNVKSRCAQFELREEVKSLFLVEENSDLASDFYSSSEESYSSAEESC